MSNNFKFAAELLRSKLSKMEFTPTDLPDPVVPAINK